MGVVENHFSPRCKPAEGESEGSRKCICLLGDPARARAGCHGFNQKRCGTRLDWNQLMKVSMENTGRPVAARMSAA